MLATTGTYTGNDTDNRAITGIGFEPSLVIIKGDSSDPAVFRTASMIGDNSFEFGSGRLTPDLIQSLDSDGFTIGFDIAVNTNGITYYYIAIRRETNDPDFNYGSYTGNGADDRNITGIGFQPTLVVIKGDQSTDAANYFDNNDDDSTGDHLFNTNSNQNNRIQALQSDGFQIGNRATGVNDNGIVYYWFAFRSVTRRITIGTYTGNATDDRNITGVGFSPNWLWIQRYAGSPNAYAVFRTSSMSGDATLNFTQSIAITTNKIQSFSSDGFQIGTASQVNTNNQAYHWFALANTSTSTSTSTSTTTSTSTSTSTTSTSTSTTSTSTSTTLTSTSTTSTSTSTTSTSSSTSTSTSTSSSTSTTSTSTSTTTTFPFSIRAEATPQE